MVLCYPLKDKQVMMGGICVNLRAKKLLGLIDQSGDTLVLLTKRENIRYFSGFTGEGALLVSSKGSFVITDSRYTEAAALQAPESAILATSRDVKITDLVRKTVGELQCKTVLFEDDEMTLKSYKAYSEALEGIAMSPVGGKPEKVRMVKDEAELASMARAESLVDKAFSWSLGFIKPGLSEMDVKTELEYQLCKLGGEGPAFSSIVCSGPNTSKPHAEPGNRAIQKGDMVTMDFGCKIDGLCSDFTRTIAVGQPPEEMKIIYQIVLEANQKAFDAVKPGLVGREVDAVARAHITDKGYGGMFGHGLGHGVGLLIHEGPSVGMKSEDVLEAGHVITIEPGIYIAGLGGVRIEDMVVVTETGARNLASSRKDLIIL